MAVMATDDPNDEPALPTPPAERRLDRPPSDRYLRGPAGGEAGGEARPTAGAPEPESEPRAGMDPRIATGLIAVLTSLLLIVLGGPLSSTEGQLFISGIGGAAMGLVLSGARLDRRTVLRGAIATAVGAVLLGAAGTWLVARSEGGVLDPIDYLWQTFGLLVPAQALVAAIAAAWGAATGPVRA
jgi:hypothetical protein